METPPTSLKPHQITILWGEAPEVGDTANTYSFATEAELDAFMLGVAEMDGWLGWRQVKPGFKVTKRNIERLDELELL